jgi:hypothetical protein
MLTRLLSLTLFRAELPLGNFCAGTSAWVELPYPGAL